MTKSNYSVVFISFVFVFSLFFTTITPQPVAQPWSFQVTAKQLILGGSLLFGLSFFAGSVYYHNFRCSMGNDVESYYKGLRDAEEDKQRIGMAAAEKMLLFDNINVVGEIMNDFDEKLTAKIAAGKKSNINNKRCKSCVKIDNWYKQHENEWRIKLRTKHDMLTNLNFDDM